MSLCGSYLDEPGRNINCVPPDIGAAIFPQALIIEAVYSCNLPGLVISANQGDPVRIPYFKAKQEEE